MLEVTPKQHYSRDDVRRMLGVSERQLRGWERLGLIRQSDSFTFRDLHALRNLLKLRESRIQPKKIGRALTSLKEKLGSCAEPLSEYTLRVGNGRNLTVQVAGQEMDAISGQILFDFDTSSHGRALTMDDRNGRADRERQSEHYFTIGLEMEERNAPEADVVAAYRKAVELNPKAAGAWVNLGTIYYRRRSYLEAEDAYRKAIEADPNYPLAHFNLGNLFDEEGDVAQANDYYRRALRLNPSYADAHFNLALLSERSGETLRAVHHYKSYLKLDGSSTWAATARKQLERLKKTTLIRKS